MFGAVQFLHVLILTLLCVQLLNSVKVKPVWKGAANSASRLLFHCLLRYACPFFPLMFRTALGPDSVSS